MKKIVLLVLILSFFATMFSFAQDSFRNLEMSLELAEKKQKNVLLVFSGSDWCKPCIQLKETILNTADFEVVLEKKIVLLEADFPYRRKNKLPKEQQIHNEQLAEKYNPQGVFPMVVLLDNSQKVLGYVQYEKDMPPQEFIRQIESIINI